MADKINELVESHENMKANMIAMALLFGAEPGMPVDPEMAKELKKRES
jgi:hypothetical protein